MENKFYIFRISEDIGGITMYPMYVEGTKKWLEFNNYTDAELWIVEHRRLGSKGIYQIQKLYVP